MACGSKKRKITVKYICGKIVYVSVHVTLIVAVLSLIVQCLIVFSTWPTYTKITVVPQQMAEFPAITICPGVKGYKEDILKVSC